MHKKISEIINKNFYDFWKTANSNKYLYHVLKGGRASAKSTHIAIWLVLALMKYPVTCLCVRKVASTLEESMFEQLKEAIDILGVSHLWQPKLNPLRLIYKPIGNGFIFRGADDSVKIKSIKKSKFPIAFLWIEELAEFKTEEEVSVIVNSVLRAELPPGLNYKIFYSYNPPKRKQSWVNKKFETQFLPSNVYVHHSTYLDNPYISKAFIQEAEEVKKKNRFKYEWEYLGKPIGSGVVPFNNLVFREITKAEIDSFDNIRQGGDWGYANDPLAFVKLHYDKTRRRIYLFDELYGVKISNRQLADWIIKNGYQYDMTIFDNAEPKSVDEIKSYDIKAKGAKKGKGSVEYGEKWLDDLDEIVIDPKRCPNAASEFEGIDYEVDKDGNTKNRLEDKDNHTIDATRYALEDDMKYRKVNGPVTI